MTGRMGGGTWQIQGILVTIAKLFRYQAFSVSSPTYFVSLYVYSMNGWAICSSPPVPFYSLIVQRSIERDVAGDAAGIKELILPLGQK